MKSSTRVAATLLLAVVLSASAYAGRGPDSVADATPFAAGPGTIISSAAAEQFSSGNTSYRRGDYAGAFKLYREAALSGVPDAQYKLALMYLSGLGVRKSMSQAEYWMRTAAKSRYLAADRALAQIHALTANG